MKGVILLKKMALMLAALLMFSACFAETIYGTSGGAYYHKDSACEFGEGASVPVTSEPITIKKAVSGGMRACPSCASDWEPYFTADFPEWNSEMKPWATGYADHVSSSLLKKWGGNVAQKIDDLCKYSYYGILMTTKYPVDYAGVYVNASGCYTILMVKPTVERAQKYSKTLKSDFWVISADYSLNELNALNNAMLLLWKADDKAVLEITSCGINVITNRVEIGIANISDKNNILKCVEALGYSRDMVTIYEYGGSWF